MTKIRTNKTLALAALAAALATAAGCAVRGSGNEASEGRDVGEFTEIDVGGALTVDVNVGPEARVEVSGDDNIVPLIETKVVDGELSIDAKERIDPKADLKIVVTLRTLSALDASGASRVTVAGVHGAELELDVSGASRATLAGEIDRLEVDASGASRVEAAELSAKHASVDASGSSNVDLAVSDSLDAEASGASSVRYRGGPSVSMDVSGAAKVEAGG